MKEYESGREVDKLMELSLRVTDNQKRMQERGYQERGYH